MIRFLIAVLLLGMFACTPQRRFNRLIEKHPHLLTTDTIYIHDTVEILVPKIEYDTIYSEHFFTEITRDTLVIQKDRLRVEIYHDTIKKNVYIRGECDTITVTKIVERKIPVKYYEKTPLWKKILGWLIFIAILYGVYRLIKFLIIKKKL